MTKQQPFDDIPRLGKLTAQDFWLLADSGAFANNARTELIEGEIWVVDSVHRWHARAMSALHLELGRTIRDAALHLELLLAGSVSMSDDSVPEPDISVIAALNADAKTIENEELRLAIEVSDSSAAHDLGRKARLYARPGVPEYWVVHRERGVLIQMWSPGGEGYAERRETPFGKRVEAATISGLAVETAGLAG